MVIAETPRLILRQFGLGDSLPLLDVFGDAVVMRYSDGVKTLAWVETWLLGEQDSYQKRGYGKWAVVRKDDVALLGYCGLSYADDVCGQAEIALGYRLVRRYWRQGYASEAVGAALNYGFAYGIGRIVATIDPGNAASLRVAEKVGMVYEKDVLYPGYTHPDRAYVIRKG